MLATQYDYDAAIEKLKAIPGAEDDAAIISMLADYETARSNLVAVSPYDITHIFFHTLVVDPSRGFALYGDAGWDNATIGFCEWMTTVYEFNQIMQQMYDRGYVLVSLYDMIEETTDADGNVHVAAKNIYLPQGKTPFVLSLDDLSYYHSYNNRGTASKMIVNEEGKPVCEYYDAEGNYHVGAYDCIPLLDEFLEEHPDFSYKGAKGTVALTGYNGILGYRTDYCYRDRVELTADQEIWLDEHPDFDWNKECEEAAAVGIALGVGELAGHVLHDLVGRAEAEGRGIANGELQDLDAFRLHAVRLIHDRTAHVVQHVVQLVRFVKGAAAVLVTVRN